MKTDNDLKNDVPYYAVPVFARHAFHFTYHVN